MYSMYSLDERMAMQLQAAEDEQYARSLNEEAVSSSNSIATKLKKDKLKEMFPSVDFVALESLFEANEFKLDPTVEAVRESFGLRAQNPGGIVKMSSDKPEDETSSDLESGSGLSYNDLRKEAQYHGQKRKEYFDKARNAYRNNQAPVAHHYSTLGRLHDQKIKEANRRAEELILLHRTRTLPWNTLDLHGLHVPEAVRALSQRLRENDRIIPQRSVGYGRQIKVITGQGKHSLRGPKIKPAIIGYLNQHQYKYEEISSGVLNVFCK